ncbi:MAG TPA: hypothetical protein VGQ19_18670 [Burkholderiales bacterium]|jgi:hypothetical protein|nr:hypothetical protein [Burkholderiales bacterium]
MARLPVNDKVALGEYIIKAAKNPDTRAELLADATTVLAKYVTYPKDLDDEGKPVQHRIQVHEDTKYVTHIVLPTQEDVEAATDQIQDQGVGMYPDEYRPDSPSYIDDKKFPLLALQFRFGEYTFGRCKH